MASCHGLMPASWLTLLPVALAGCREWKPNSPINGCNPFLAPFSFCNSKGHYCVFRQARQQRNDLSRRISLIIGGHIDQGSDNKPVAEVFEETVRREVSEEVGVDLDCSLMPVGMVVDAASLMASKHIGFVYEAVLDRDLKSLSSEEFSVRSKYNGQFFSIESLSKLRSKLDPWSSILFSQYLRSGLSMDLGRQSKFLMSTE